jgi:hypothetical protein
MLKKQPQPQPEKPLGQSIEAFRAELDAWIDAKAADIREKSPGVPLPVIRNMFTNRFFGCQCQTVLILEQDT